MKQFAKAIIVRLLGWQVRRLRSRHKFTVIGVVGSIGKTSTKFAIAQLLSASRKVQYQQGNYNDIVSVPLVLFGHAMPSLFNPIAWSKIFLANEKIIAGSYDYEFVVLELGTDGPGQLQEFTQYLHCEIGIVTAIAPEHMEFFKTLDAVADEEFSVALYSDQLVYNRDLCKDYVPETLIPSKSYGKDPKSDFKIVDAKFDKEGASFVITTEYTSLRMQHRAISWAQVYSLTAAVSVGHELGLSNEEISKGVSAIRPVSGRMQLLQGVNGSTIIDETYNASPDAMKSALEALYTFPSPHKIALLGNMNELGEVSPALHREVGGACDPSKLALIVTLGPDANKYLAPAAEKRGCKVVRATTPYEAAEHIKPLMKPDTVLLAKGSQNGVFAEEAVKLLLGDPKDAGKLVRQSDDWISRKRKSFEHA